MTKFNPTDLLESGNWKKFERLMSTPTSRMCLMVWDDDRGE